MKRLLVLLVVLVVSCRPPEEPLVLSGASMGTTWKLAWRGASVPGIEEDVTETLRKWEDVLSQWKPDSDLSRFNRGEPATSDLQRVIDLAEEIRKASGGAFDHRLLKETGQAGFGPGGQGIDLSAIGKGFAVDRVGEMLRQRGITDFVFELGGEILAGDEEWEVAIEKPDPATRETAMTVMLENRALATSGNYRQFKPAKGGLASHIIDPKTGKPVIRPPSSVSVMAKDCATADAWATAFFVMGSDDPIPDGLEVIWHHGQ
ncbi:MAG: Thiamine biosynthesis lipoprotein [Verrucomicrobiota bacterium]